MPFRKIFIHADACTHFIIHSQTSKKVLCSPILVRLRKFQTGQIPFLAEQINVCQAVANVSENKLGTERRKNNLHVALGLNNCEIDTNSKNSSGTTHITCSLCVLPNWGGSDFAIWLWHIRLPRKKFRVFEATCYAYIAQRDILQFFFQIWPHTCTQSQCGSAVAKDASWMFNATKWKRIRRTSSL